MPKGGSKQTRTAVCRSNPVAGRQLYGVAAGEAGILRVMLSIPKQPSRHATEKNSNVYGHLEDDSSNISNPSRRLQVKDDSTSYIGDSPLACLRSYREARKHQHRLVLEVQRGTYLPRGLPQTISKLRMVFLSATMSTVSRSKSGEQMSSAWKVGSVALKGRILLAFSSSRISPASLPKRNSRRLGETYLRGAPGTMMQGFPFFEFELQLYDATTSCPDGTTLRLPPTY